MATRHSYEKFYAILLVHANEERWKICQNYKIEELVESYFKKALKIPNDNVSFDDHQLGVVKVSQYVPRRYSLLNIWGNNRVNMLHL